ncbi:unnamed protein product, partial [marine sediment metagenome]
VDRPGHDQRYAINFQKLQNELGWCPTLNFQEGIAQTVRWYLEHPEWVANVVGGEYRNIRLGTFPG